MDYLSHQGEPPRSYLDPRLSGYYDVYNEDVQFINSWLLDKGKFQQNLHRKPKPEININFAKKSLKRSLEIFDKLKSTQEELQSNVETMSTSEWKAKTLEIGNLRSELDKLMQVFEDNVNLCYLKRLVKARAKKRLNRKKNRSFKAEDRKKTNEKLLEEHKQADRWLESKKEEVERAKMEERMKKDADCVLYEVTKKKSEARKELSLIAALVKLRSVRDSMAVQRGEKTSLDDRKAFGAVTEKLIRMWENASQNYGKEEQCLRLMLEHNADKDTKAAQLAKEGLVVREWERRLFGEKDPGAINNATYWALTSAERDLETFVAIRKSWDTFLTNPSDPSGSTIPIGWVIPPTKPNETWTKYLN